MTRKEAILIQKMLEPYKALKTSKFADREILYTVETNSLYYYIKIPIGRLDTSIHMLSLLSGIGFLVRYDEDFIIIV